MVEEKKILEKFLDKDVSFLRLNYSDRAAMNLKHKGILYILTKGIEANGYGRSDLKTYYIEPWVEEYLKKRNTGSVLNTVKTHPPRKGR